MLRGKDNGPCGDERFYSQDWLASPAEQREITCRVWPSVGINRRGRNGYELVGVVPIKESDLGRAGEGRRLTE